MNERTLELYKLAHVPHTDIDPSNNMPYETTIFSAEKFAELIIQECVTACEDNSWMMLDAYQRSSQIKKHFGIE